LNKENRKTIGSNRIPLNILIRIKNRNQSIAEYKKLKTPKSGKVSIHGLNDTVTRIPQKK
jgi:hypothetical protein